MSYDYSKVEVLRDIKDILEGIRLELVKLNRKESEVVVEGE